MQLCGVVPETLALIWESYHPASPKGLFRTTTKTKKPQKPTRVKKNYSFVTGLDLVKEKICKLTF